MYYVQTYIHLIAALKLFFFIVGFAGPSLLCSLSLVAAWGLLTGGAWALGVGGLSSCGSWA